MLEFQNLTIRRDNRTILDQLHMEIPPGTILGLVGPDDDAKTTILRTAAGIEYPSEGDVLLDGDSVFDKKSGAWMRYGYMSKDHVLFHQLKLFEYYEMYLSLYKIRGRIARIRIEDLIEELNLLKYTDLYLEELPLEMKSFVSLGQAILHEPKWLYLNQPFDGLDGAGRERMRNLLGRLNEEGVSIILNCSMLPEVAGMLTDVLVLEEGRVAISGPIEEVVERVTRAILPQALMSLPAGTLVYRQVGRTMTRKNTTTQHSQQQAIYLASAPKMPAPYWATEKAIRLITPRGESSMK